MTFIPERITQTGHLYRHTICSAARMHMRRMAAPILKNIPDECISIGHADGKLDACLGVFMTNISYHKKENGDLVIWNQWTTLNGNPCIIHRY